MKTAEKRSGPIRFVLGLVWSSFFLSQFATSAALNAQSLSNSQLREIESISNRLNSAASELHKEFHEHLTRVKHGEKLEEDVTTIERLAQSLSAFAKRADNSEASMDALRRDTTDLIRVAFQVRRTIDLAERWSPTNLGIAHMREAAQEVIGIAGDIDRYLPVDTKVIDEQLVELEAATEELHKEFHEHLDGYEISAHLDEDLEELEKRVKHIHETAHGKDWRSLNTRHLLDDLREVAQSSAHIEKLFDQQARIGVRTSSYVGIEHSTDALTDVLAAVRLIEQMIFKFDSSLNRRQDLAPPPQPQPMIDSRPKRDRPNYPR